MADDNFGGAWLVTEYVHDPDGTFVGIVRQRRLVQQLDDNRLRVTQSCEPDAALAAHPMGAFRGEWIFDMEVHGRHRHYLGPDVVGLGTEWHDGAMTGRGLWPRFGHEFSSYGVLVAPDRQLTGGFFSLAGRPVADIVGVAAPEAAGIDPRLDLSAEPPDLDGVNTVSRRIGPMRVAQSQPTPTEHGRTYALHDVIGGCTVTIAERTTSGATPGVETTITIS